MSEREVRVSRPGPVSQKTLHQFPKMLAACLLEMSFMYEECTYAYVYYVISYIKMSYKYENSSGKNSRFFKNLHKVVDDMDLFCDDRSQITVPLCTWSASSASSTSVLRLCSFPSSVSEPKRVFCLCQGADIRCGKCAEMEEEEEQQCVPRGPWQPSAELRRQTQSHL